jgi:hypothetical protein
MIRIKFVSGLEKVFADGNFEDYAALPRLSLLRGERVGLQVVCEQTANEAGNNFSAILAPTLAGPLAKYATIRRVQHVPALLNGRATPDSDYDTRMALYEQILRIDPGHEKYKAALEQCRQQKAGITIQPSDAASSAVSAQEGMGKYVKSIGIAIGVILLVVWLVQTFF